MKKENKKAIQQILDQVYAGKYGTPETPDRNASNRARFWNGFFGFNKPSDFYNTNAYPQVKAGEIYAHRLGMGVAKK